MKERLEPIEGAWHSFVVEFPSCPKVRSGEKDVLQKIIFMCDFAEKNPAELCFAFFGPQILLKQYRVEDDLTDISGVKMTFVYSAELPANLKSTLDLFQEKVNTPVLVSQRSNVQKSAQHVLDYLRLSDQESPGAPSEERRAAATTDDMALMPLPENVSIWSGKMPVVTMIGEKGQAAEAKLDIQDYRAEYACRYVLSNYAQNINRDFMAGMGNLSPGYFSNLFRLEIGMSFSDYLIQVRIDSAKKLLRRFDLSVDDVSKQCGFNSLAHFSRTFKDRCGMPPLRYRKNPNA